MRVVVGSDHAGFELKTLIADHLRAAGHEVVDLGTTSAESVDYPDYGEAVGRAVVEVTDGRVSDGSGPGPTSGVVVCGTGIGIGIAANKVPGVRAATVHDVTSARLGRQHNDANVISLGARLIGPEVALEAVDVFLTTDFDGGERHRRRVAKLDGLGPGPSDPGASTGTTAPPPGSSSPEPTGPASVSPDR